MKNFVENARYHRQVQTSGASLVAKVVINITLPHGQMVEENLLQKRYSQMNPLIAARRLIIRNAAFVVPIASHRLPQTQTAHRDVNAIVKSLLLQPCSMPGHQNQSAKLSRSQSYQYKRQGFRVVANPGYLLQELIAL